MDCDWHLYSLVFSLPSLIRKSNLCTFDFQQQHHQTTTIISFLRVQVVYKAKRKQSLVFLFWISISPNWFICWLDGLFALNTPEPLAWFILIHLHYFIFLSKHLIMMTSYSYILIYYRPLIVIDIVSIFWKFQKSPRYYYYISLKPFFPPESRI